MENSIKEFCFRLNQDEEPILDLKLTPVKKWTEQKKNREKIISERMLTQPADIQESGKNLLRKEIQDCLEIL